MGQFSHEEFRNLVGRGLSVANSLGFIGGSFTYQSANTTLAQWRASNLTQFAAVHEDQRSLPEIANGFSWTLDAVGIYRDADVAASNTQATWEAIFTAQDPSFPATYVGGRR